MHAHLGMDIDQAGGGRPQAISAQGALEYGISIARFLRSGNSKREIPSEKISR